MDNKEAIIQATIALLRENGENLEAITVREICKSADVGLGLVNYHFGNKDNLIELCVERIINGIVENFQSIREKTKDLPPFEKLEYLGNMTLPLSMIILGVRLADMHFVGGRQKIFAEEEKPRQKAWRAGFACPPANARVFRREVYRNFHKFEKICVK